MIDTLMAFWNQNRRRRAAQLLLTFFLMCISISLLFVAMSLPQWSHTHPKGSVTGRAGDKGSMGAGVTTPTAIVQITQEPEMTPTSTVIVPSQITPTPAGGASSCTTPDAQVNVNNSSATTSTGVASQQAPVNTSDTPVSHTPSPVTHSPITPTPGTTGVVHSTPTAIPTMIAKGTLNATATTTAATPTVSPTVTRPVTPTATVTAIPTVQPATTATQTSGSPLIPAHQQGGGPLNTGTPISASPVPGSTPPGATQHIGGGWISTCTGNDIGMVAGANIVAILWQHLWLILGASLLCTVLFYAIVRRIHL